MRNCEAIIVSIEIERKFLVKSEAWRAQAEPGQPYEQGYLWSDAVRTVRVRIAGDRAFMTIKGKTEGLARSEYEYPIPVADAAEMLATLCVSPPIAKLRYRLPCAEGCWEIDEFLGSNAGLVVAEIELDRTDRPIALPDWVGEEVSHDPRYRNSALADRPFSTWESTP